MNKWFYLAGFALILLFTACGEDDDNRITDNFDRASMLQHWTDNIIIPGYTDFSNAANALQASATTFNDDPSLGNFQQVKTDWATAYRAWQRVSMFEIGKAEAILYRNQINIYPTDPAAIENNLAGAEYNLELPSTIDQQGFPALDYLLFGLADNETEILARYTSNGSGVAHRDYLLVLCTRIKSLTDQVLADWNGGFKDEFIANSGNDANASVDRLVNDYMFYYEKFLRAGKVGIPAGVFAGSELPDLVEARYNGTLAKTLLLDALQASQDFFNGDYASGSGLSLANYLDELERKKEDQLLSKVINDQFEASRTQINLLGDDFREQVINDNLGMLTAYDALQLNVTNMKTDMLQGLNINVDYVDADGD